MMRTSKSHWPLSLLGGLVSMMNLIFPLILVRILGQSEVGMYKIFFLYLVLVPWFCMTAGINNGLGHWAGRDELRVRAFSNSWTLLVTVASTVLVIGMGGSPWLSQWLGWTVETTRLFAWGAFITILATFFDDAMIAAGNIWRGAVFSSGFDLARNLTMIACAVYFKSITAVFWAHISVLTLKTALGAFWGYREGLQRFSWNSEIIRSIVKYAVPVSMSAALTICVNYADQLILSRVLEASEFAIYALGCLQVPPLYILEQAVNRVLIPGMSKAFANNRGDEARALYRDAVSELSWLMIPAMFGMFVFADPIIELLFTKKYAASASYLRVFAFTYIILMMPYDAVARARGDGKTILRQLSGFAVLSLPAGYVGGLYFGAMGVLVGMASCQVAMRMAAIVGVHRRENWAWSQMLPWREMATYASATAVASLAGYVTKFYLGNGVPWLLGGGLAFSLVYFAGTLPLFLRRRAEKAPRPGVILLTQYLGLGGLERVVLNLAHGLQQAGSWAPTVVVYDEIPGAPTLHGEFEKINIPVVSLVKKRGVDLKVVKRIALEVIRRRILVIHSHDLGGLIYAVLAKWMTFGTVRIVHTQHSFIHLEKSARYKTYEKLFTYFADEVTTVSEALRTQYATVDIDPELVKVIPNGMAFPGEPVLANSELRRLRAQLIERVVDVQVKAELTARIDRVWVLCMARIHPKKGQDQVAALWDKIPDSIKSKATLIFVGAETFSGALQKLQLQLAALKQPSEAIYAGFTQTPTSWLQAADVFVSGSEFEGMPLGPIEAVGAGLQVLVSDIPGHSMLPDTVSRFELNNPGDGAAKLAALISAVVTSPEEVRASHWRHGEESRVRYGIAGMSKSYQALYMSASASSSREARVS